MKRTLVIHWGEDTIHVAIVDPARENCRISEYRSFPAGDIKSLSSWVSVQGCSSLSASILITGQSTHHEVLLVPDMGATEMEAVIHREVLRHSKKLGHSLLYDYTILSDRIEKGIRKKQVLIITTPEEALFHRLSQLSRLGIDVRFATSVPVALIQLLNKESLPLHSESFAIISIGFQDAHVVIFHEGVIRFHREIPFGIKVKKVDDSTDNDSSRIRILVSEIRRTLLYFAQSNPDVHLDSILLTGVGEHEEEFRTQLEQGSEFAVTFVGGSGLSYYALNSSGTEDLSLLLCVTGSIEPRRATINLIPKKIRDRKSRVLRWLIYSVALITFLIALGTGSIVLNRVVETYEEIIRTQQQTYKRSESTIDRQQVALREIDSYRDMVIGIDQVRGGNYFVSDIFTSILQITPTQVCIERLWIETRGEDRIIRVQGQIVSSPPVRQTEVFHDYFEAMSKLQHVSDVEIVSLFTEKKKNRHQNSDSVSIDEGESIFFTLEGRLNDS